MASATRFFYAHAGYGYDRTETKNQGRWRCARELARAEHEARERGWTYEWEYESDWSCGDLGCDRTDEHEHEVLSCVLRNSRGDVLESLGMIEQTVGNGYTVQMARDHARVVEAGLASQALAELAESVINAGI